MNHCRYASPLGELLLSSDGDVLTGLCFLPSDCEAFPKENFQMGMPAALREGIRWLDLYFGGAVPDFIPPLAPEKTPFRRAVRRLLLRIPYGTTVSYGAIAGELQRITGQKTSARAVGGAVGHNPLLLIVPCHRVVGADGSLTGYAGGTERKSRLLLLERGADPATKEKKEHGEDGDAVFGLEKNS